MESEKLQSIKEGDHTKKSTSQDKDMLREATRTFLRVKKRVEVRNFVETKTNFLLSSLSKDSENKIDLNEQTISSVISVLIEAVEKIKITKSLVDIFSAIKLSQIEYINLQADRLFSDGYTFTFDFKAGTCFMEIIDYNGYILQTGFKLIYSKKLFSQIPDKDLKKIMNYLKQYYLNDLPQIISGVKLTNYANNVSQSYVSRFTIEGKKVNNFNIMNKTTWSNATKEHPG